MYSVRVGGVPVGSCHWHPERTVELSVGDHAAEQALRAEVPQWDEVERWRASGHEAAAEFLGCTLESLVPSGAEDRLTINCCRRTVSQKGLYHPRILVSLYALSCIPKVGSGVSRLLFR